MQTNDVEDIYPLTPVQQGMLFHSIDAPDEGMYVQQALLTLRGVIDATAMAEAAAKLVRRHAALRSVVLWEGLERPLQVVLPNLDLAWQYQDLGALGADACQQTEQALVREDRLRGFDLAKGPLVRFMLLQLGHQQTRLLVSFHHIIADGWSLQLLLQDLAQLYSAQCTSSPLTLTPAPRFSDYIGWLERQSLPEAQDFWRQALAGLTSRTPLALPLPPDPPAPPEHRGEQRQALDEATIVSINEAARRFNITANTLVLAAWSLVLNRYTAEDDILFGTTLAGRPHSLRGSQNMVGMFLETVPVRATFASDLTVEQLLTTLHWLQLESVKQAHAGLARVRHWCDFDPSGQMFDTLVVFEHVPGHDEGPLQFGQATLESISFMEPCNYPLALLVRPGIAWRVDIIHDQRRVSAASARNLLASFTRTLQSLCNAQADDVTTAISHLGAAEDGQIGVWSSGDELRPVETTWLGRLQRCIKHSPEAVAIHTPTEQWTYRDLDLATRRRAHQLRAMGINRGDRVGIDATRTAGTLLSLIAILRAGAVYVPLDPSQPLSRRRVIAADAGLALWLADREGEDLGVRCEQLTEQPIPLADKDPLPQPDAADAAYLIYTSGSTGTPRGVLVNHRNLLYSTAARYRYYDQSVERFLLLPGFGFDSSVAGIFWTLGDGGTLVLPAEGRHDDVEHLLSLAADQNVSHLLCVPSLYQLLLERADDRLASLQFAIVAGEPCPASVLQAHANRLPGARLFNEYGPTEATVWSTVAELTTQHPGSRITIGKPIPGVQVHVLDRHRRLAPVGVPGELCIAGDTVTSGYLNCPGETEAKFLSDPQNIGGRMYCSGDVVRWLEDGNLAFVGRLDEQLKLHGQRIEPGEIEAALGAHEPVNEACVQLLQRESDTGAAIEALLHRLQELPSAKADAALLAVAGKSGRSVFRQQGPGAAFSIELDDHLVATPRQAQRQWFINQLLSELRDDLRALDERAKELVPGGQALLADLGDVSGMDLEGNQIMEDWQLPILQAMAELVCSGGGNILEIGFGLGVSASMIQALGVRSHTIIEANEQCIQRYYQPWVAQFPDRDIRMVSGQWQDVCDELGDYDGVFFHTAARSLDELAEATVDQVTYAGHFFPTAARLLKPGGVFTYLSNDIDSLSRGHQRLLLEHFRSFSVRRIDDLQIPQDTRDAWWSPSMVVVGAVK